MGFGTPPTPPYELKCEDVLACLEGDYSNWEKIWQYDFPDGLFHSTDVSITLSKDYVYIAYKDDSLTQNIRFAIIKIADATPIFTSPAGSDYQISEPFKEYTTTLHFNTLTDISGGSFSILSKYICIVNELSNRIRIWKDGVNVWTSDLASNLVVGAMDFTGIIVRYDGRYIVALTDNKKLVCFEGS